MGKNDQNTQIQQDSFPMYMMNSYKSTVNWQKKGQKSQTYT